MHFGKEGIELVLIEEVQRLSPEVQTIRLALVVIAPRLGTIGVIFRVFCGDINHVGKLRDTQGNIEIEIGFTNTARSEDLREFGYEVTTACDGREAFELIRTGRFRLVVSDWQMPHMSGIELCREMRSRFPDTPIVFMSAAAQESTIEEAISAGANRYFVKPFDPDELRDIVKELLSGSFLYFMGSSFSSQYHFPYL